MTFDRFFIQTIVLPSLLVQSGLLGEKVSASLPVQQRLPCFSIHVGDMPINFINSRCHCLSIVYGKSRNVSLLRIFEANFFVAKTVP